LVDAFSYQTAIDSIRADFPLLKEIEERRNMVFLDSAASSQKPQVVIDEIGKYYKTINANVHRGVYQLSQEATDAFEASRSKIAQYINAAQEYEVIFTKGTTESINLVAYSFGQQFIKKGDVILVSEMEHHANIVPWQLLCERTGAILEVIPLLENGTLDLEVFESKIKQGVKLLSIVHVSNALGTINPVKEMVQKAHSYGVPVLIDGAQSITHLDIDVQDLDADFFVFSGHKLFGPTGVGVLYGKEKWLNKLPPYQGGGEMIKTVTFQQSTWADLPHRFEAGTPNIAGVVGMGKGIDYLKSLNPNYLRRHESYLLKYATERLMDINGIKIYGEAPNKTGVISFLLAQHHPYDVGVLLDQMGIAVRTGHHCAQPIMDYYGIPGTIRASFSIYNNSSDIDRLVQGVSKAAKMLG
jgi:cysteine desulfurase/selenocysteine lyase